MHDKLPPHRGEAEPESSTASTASTASATATGPAALLRLQRSAGNTATTLLLQRIPVTKHDKKVLKRLKDTEREAVEKKLKAMPETLDAEWRRLSDWFSAKRPKKKEQAEAELRYLANLYAMLLRNAPFSEIGDFRAAYARALELGGAPTGSGPEEPPGKLGAKREVKAKGPAPRPGFGFDVGPQELHSALHNLKPLRDDANKSSNSNSPPPGFAGFPANEQAFLQTVFERHRGGRIARWQDVYDKHYKLSDVKARMPQPTANEYIASVRAEDKRQLEAGGKPLPRDVGITAGSEKDENALRTGGYPITTPQGGIGYRVYLNVHVAHAAEVFGHVHKLKEVSRAKLGSHAVVSSARDSIVVYTENEPAAQILFRSIADYQSQPLAGRRTKADYFVDEIVHMTQPVPGLIGVSHSGDLSPLELRKANQALQQSEKGKAARLAERPLYEGIGFPEENETVNLSFSQLRSMLIYQALVSANRNWQAFQQDVVRNFRIAGLSSLAPWESGKATPELIHLLSDLIYQPYRPRSST